MYINLPEFTEEFEWQSRDFGPSLRVQSSCQPRRVGATYLLGATVTLGTWASGKERADSAYKWEDRIQPFTPGKPKQLSNGTRFYVIIKKKKTQLSAIGVWRREVVYIWVLRNSFMGCFSKQLNFFLIFYQGNNFSLKITKNTKKIAEGTLVYPLSTFRFRLIFRLIWLQHSGIRVSLLFSPIYSLIDGSVSFFLSSFLLAYLL